MILSDDCLMCCFEYLDPNYILYAVCCVCKHWLHLGSSDSIWRNLCLSLWKDKQNHPLERWALVPLLSTCDLLTAALDKYKKYCDQEARQTLDFGITGSMLQTMHRSLLDPILEISSEQFSSGVGQDDKQEYMELLSEMEKLRETTRMYWADKMKQIIDLTRQKYGDMIMVRRYAPCSRCVRAMQIKLELDRCLSMFEDISTEEYLILNRHIENAITDNLKGRTTVGEEWSSEVLSWKDSYWASLEDSQRDWITYEELRELSDWVQIWGGQDGFPREYSLARFVSGGVELIDNDKFFHCGEYVSLVGNCLVFMGVPYAATISRNPSNWSWCIQFDNMTPPCVMESREYCSSQVPDGVDSAQCEPLRSPLAALPRYAIYPSRDKVVVLSSTAETSVVN